MISRRQFIGGMIGLGVGGGAFLRSEDQVFPKMGPVRRIRRFGPASAKGKRAVFVTDVHYGRHFGEKEAKVLNAAVRKEKPDVVLLGGDLADRPQLALDGFFANWAPGCPTLFAPGNHDLRIGTNQPVLRQAAAAGLEVLCNDAVTWHGVNIVGFPSALREQARLELLRSPGFTLLLAHEPDTWDWWGAGQRPGLQLSGHSHGGQVRVFHRPILLPTLGKKYPLGEYTRPGGGDLVVSAGVGCSGPAFRFECPPEICTLDFV